MRKFKIVTLLALCMGFLFITISWVVVSGKNHGVHKGWCRNANNPHDPYHSHGAQPEKHRGKIKR